MLLALAVRAYWIFWPKRWKKTCIYKESCSRYVYRLALETGTLAGLAGFFRRMRTCRTGYRFVVAESVLFMEAADGTLIHRSDLSAALLEEAMIVARLTNQVPSKGARSTGMREGTALV